MNILPWKGERILEEDFVQKQQTALSRQNSSITTSISQRNGNGATYSPKALKTSHDKRDYCFSQQPRLNPQSSHYRRTIQVLLSLNRRRGWEWEEFHSPAHPSCHCLCFYILLSTQPHPISEQVTDSSQNLTTWPLSIGITLKPPRPGPDGK